MFYQGTRFYDVLLKIATYTVTVLLKSLKITICDGRILALVGVCPSQCSYTIGPSSSIQNTYTLLTLVI